MAIRTNANAFEPDLRPLKPSVDLEAPENGDFQLIDDEQIYSNGSQQFGNQRRAHWRHQDALCRHQRHDGKIGDRSADEPCAWP
jgi:hypothetical protein